MLALLAFVGLAFVVAGHVGAHFGARVAAARALRGRVGPGVVVAIGPLGNYLFAALLGTLGALAGGRNVVDDESMRVVVGPGGAAEEAGMRTGDRIVTLDGAQVRDWDDLRTRVRARAGRTIDVGIERDGAALHVAPRVSINGKILVGPPSRHEDVGVAAASVRGLALPFEVWASIAKGMYGNVAGTEKAEMVGPVGIVRELEASPARPNYIGFFAVVAAYFLPPAFLLVLVRRRVR